MRVKRTRMMMKMTRMMKMKMKMRTSIKWRPWDESYSHPTGTLTVTNWNASVF